MNYYNLQEFAPIKTDELLNAFTDNKVLKEGCISVFEDSIGKPGDRFSELRNLSFVDDCLSLEFGGNEKITIKGADHIVINSKAFGIQFCKEIVWECFDLKMVFEPKGNSLETLLESGQHNFKTNQNAPAFLFYTW